MDAYIRKDKSGPIYELDGREMSNATAIIYLRKQGFDREDACKYLDELNKDHIRDTFHQR